MRNLRGVRDIRGRVCSTLLEFFLSGFRLLLFCQYLQTTKTPITGIKRRRKSKNQLVSPVVSSGTSSVFITFCCVGSFVPAFGERRLLGLFVVFSGTGAVAVKIDRWTWLVNLSSPWRKKATINVFICHNY